MDVRAKQRLCYQRVFLPSACVVAVSPHVISALMLLSCAMPQKVEDECVERMFEKSVRFCKIGD